MQRTFFKTTALLALGLSTLISVPQPAHAQIAQVSQKPVLTTLHRFDFTHGANPATTLTFGTDGNFYGTTFSFTTVYKMTPDGQITTLHNFNSLDGTAIVAALTQGKDGAFYGVAQRGGSKDLGTAFRITPDGQFKRLHTFTGTDGAIPFGALLLAPDGSFYGTTESGGVNNNGTVFHMTLDGIVTILHFFTSGGTSPRGNLVFGQDGALYGTTDRGGTRNCGTVYRLTTGGAFSILHSFTGSGGAFPDGGLTVGPDGLFYGMTDYCIVSSAVSNSGIVYKITPSGVFTTLHKFSEDGHGDVPMAALTVGPDNLFYGTTERGGTDDRGTVFVMTPTGQVTTLYKFHTDFDGFNLFAGVAFGPSGALYGTTFMGGSKGYGTIYKLTLP